MARHLLADAPYVAWGFSLAWMPDNRRIVMSGSPLHGGSARLLVLDTAAETLTPLTAGKDWKAIPRYHRTAAASPSCHSGPVWI